MVLVYKSVLKRVRFSAGDSQRLAELTAVLQKQSVKRLNDSDVIRQAITIALTISRASALNAEHRKD